jgi:maltose O-acetyltransferase
VAPVVIGRYAWLAVNVVILPGVTIGEGAMIACGSVVTKSIPPMVLAAGTPAVVKKDLSQSLKKNYDDDTFESILQKRKAEFGF